MYEVVDDRHALDELQCSLCLLQRSWLVCVAMSWPTSSSNTLGRSTRAAFFRDEGGGEGSREESSSGAETGALRERVVYILQKECTLTLHTHESLHH